MIAKVGCCLLGLSAISVGGVALTNPEWVGITTSIKWKPLALDNGFAGKTAQDQEYHNKFGSTHRSYLTGLDKVNEGWWNDRFNRIGESKPTKGRFKGIDAGYTGTNSLKSRCEEAYKKNETDLKTDNANLPDTDFLKEEVWKYCSYVEEEPKTINKNNGEENDYGSETNAIGKTKKENLLSAKGENNKKLWELKNDEFFGRGVFGKATEPSDAFFKELFKEKDNNKDKDALKNKCLAAYKLTSTENPNNNQTKDEHVIKYCSSKSIQK